MAFEVSLLPEFCVTLVAFELPLARVCNLVRLKVRPLVEGPLAVVMLALEFLLPRVCYHVAFEVARVSIKLVADFALHVRTSLLGAA